MDDVLSALWAGVLIGSVVTVAVRPLSDWIYRRMVQAWNERKEATR
jgi:hypothetical protein